MITFRIEGLQEVDKFIRDCPLASRRKQIGLSFGAARKLRRQWQNERRAAAPRGRRRRRLSKSLRGVRVWIPRSATLDTWPEIRVVGPRHMVPTNARSGRYTGWLNLDGIGPELAEQMEADLRRWIARRRS